MQRGENRVIHEDTVYGKSYINQNYVNKNHINRNDVNRNKELKEDLIIKRHPSKRQAVTGSREAARQQAVTGSKEAARRRESHEGVSRRGAVRAREAAWYQEEIGGQKADRQALSYQPVVRRRPAYREPAYGKPAYGAASRRREMRRRKKRLRRLRRTTLLFGIITIGILSAVSLRYRVEEEDAAPVFNLLTPFRKTVEAPEIQQLYLTPNEYSRPGDKLGKVKNIFVHYTANPETSARQNRSYFENLKDTQERSASAHFIIGYEGEIVQCIPLEEQAYAVMTRNGDSISIECCYINEDGSFTRETYDSLVSLLAWLLCEYRLEPEDILRHYDCGGKLCPVYYVEHETEWERLKKDVADYIEEENV